MQDLVNLIVNNGIGVASFVAMLYFFNSYLKNINDTMLAIKDNLSVLNERVDKLEEKNKIEEL